MNSNSLPAQFSFSHRLLLSLRNKSTQSVIQDLKPVITEGNITIKIDDIKYCKNERINNLFVALKPYSEFVQVFLHGSWADNTKTAFSDIDDYVIINLQLLREQNLLSKVLNILNKIDMEFCRIDSIQHHGHWLCSKEDLSNYDNSFMPLDILKESKSVIGENFIEGSVNTELSKIGLKKNISNTCEGIKKLSELYFNNKINAYQLKGLVGSFVLMPAFIFQVKGENCTKPEAIAKASMIFSESSISCIQWSTHNRNNWGFITNDKKYKFFSIFSHLFSDPHLWRRFSRNFSPPVTEIQKDNLSSIPLTNNAVAKFVTESLEYAK